MRQVNNNKDGFYELKPYIIFFAGVFGLLNNIDLSGSTLMLVVSKMSSLVLLFSAYKIYRWRQAYRSSGL